MRVVIAGGGVIGWAIAYNLARAGARVIVLERGEIGGQASGAAAGMLIPPAESVPPGPFRELCLASLAMYPELIPQLEAESGVDPQYLAPGALLVAETEGHARAMKAYTRWLQGLGRAVEWVEGETVRALEPGLSPRLLGASYSPDGRHVNPGLLTQGFARAAVSRGAEVRPMSGVAGFVRRGARVSGARTDTGVVDADAVVLAAGSWTKALAAKLGANVPVRPVRGQMLAYRSTAIRHIVWGDDGYLVPKAGGFIFAGATVEDVGFRAATTRSGLARMRRMASSLVPALRYAQVASEWAGLRPGSPDGLPVIGRLPGWDNVYVATGHFRNGILLAPITGRLVSRLVLEGRADTDLRPFDPGRFA
jgi:glycine oxidase